MESAGQGITRRAEAPSVLAQIGIARRRSADFAALDRLLVDTPVTRIALTTFAAKLRAGGVRRAEALKDAVAGVGQGTYRAPDVPVAVPKAAAPKRRSTDIVAIDHLRSDAPEAVVARKVFGAQLRVGALLRADARDATIAPVGQGPDHALDLPVAVLEAAVPKRRSTDIAALDSLLSDTSEAFVARKVFGAQLRAGVLLRADARNATVVPVGQWSDRVPDMPLAKKAATPNRRSTDIAALDSLLSDAPEAFVARKVFGAQLRAYLLLRADTRDATIVSVGQEPDRAPNLPEAAPKPAASKRRSADISRKRGCR